MCHIEKKGGKISYVEIVVYVQDSRTYGRKARCMITIRASRGYKKTITWTVEDRNMGPRDISVVLGYMDESARD